MMKLKSMLLMGSMMLSFASMAQIENWSYKLRIFPDEKNEAGCYLETGEVFFTFDNRNLPTFMFALQSCTPTEDFVNYFGQSSSDESKLVLISRQILERIIEPEEDAKNSDQSYEAEVRVFNRTIPVGIKLSVERVKKTNQILKKLTFKIDNGLLHLEREGSTTFMIILEPK